MNRSAALLLLLVPLLHACDRSRGDDAGRERHPNSTRVEPLDSITRLLVDSAIAQTRYTREYDPSYVVIDYPGGDVPTSTGVCADVIVRAFRAIGLDLQRLVHEDMSTNFSAYPQLWGLRAPDRNIDHRRVANLMTWFERAGKSVTQLDSSPRFLPGDVVSWRLDNGRLHIGIVSDSVSPDTRRNNVVHNIGAGTRLEDVLESWSIIGHYRQRLGGAGSLQPGSSRHGRATDRDRGPDDRQSVRIHRSNNRDPTLDGNPRDRNAPMFNHASLS